MPRISLIITVYNWPEALERCLSALNEQSCHNFEVIIADDGSGSAIKQLINTLKPSLHFPITHCWQTDLGFRAARARNLAARIAKAPYLLFMDSDCIAPIDFISRHIALAEQGYFVPGNRILLNQAFTESVLRDKKSISHWRYRDARHAAKKGDINRSFPALTLPLGPLRKCFPRQWKGAKTCNLGIWKADFDAIGGFDDSFIGWGYEDSDLVIRLIKQGIKRKSGKHAVPVYHLWHKENDRTDEPQNKEKLNHLLKSSL